MDGNGIIWCELPAFQCFVKGSLLTTTDPWFLFVHEVGKNKSCYVDNASSPLALSGRYEKNNSADGSNRINL